jgi:hypothetical protein
MQLQQATVLVLGGWGLVGSALCRRLLREAPRRLVLTSLRQSEAEQACAELRALFPDSPTQIEARWGDIFVRQQWKDIPRAQLLAQPQTRAQLIEDILGELDAERLHSSALYQLLQEVRPDVVLDCINTATAIAYQDIYSTAQSAWEAHRRTGAVPEETFERLLSSLYIPQLIRHVQILYHGLVDAGTRLYLKIGTTGTGGMGLNIPYTHSEERPSRVLLAKSAVAGAHSLLLFLMGRTPGAPIIKELKPAAIIGWKRIAYDIVLFRGQPLERVDLPPSDALELGSTFPAEPPPTLRSLGEALRSVFIDTGENGLFSRAEFETVTALGQMELITPEEIAEAAVYEVLGGNTGYDIVAALDAAVMGPTYRGGALRSVAVELLRQLEQRHATEGIAFEMLGPPRLTKLLYEAHLLKRCYGRADAALKPSAEELSARLLELLQQDAALRSQILSIGLVILLPDGRHYLRGKTVRVPAAREALPCSAEQVERWCEAGWIDLRPSNMERWQQRLRRMLSDATAAHDTSSASGEHLLQWTQLPELDEASLAVWILVHEEHGFRWKR